MRFGVSPFRVGARIAWHEMHNGRMTGVVVNDSVDITGSIRVKPDGNCRKGWKRVRDLQSA